MKSPRDVIIRPVVTEKSYAGLEAQHLHVPGRPVGEQDRDQGSRPVDLERPRRLRVNTINRKGKVKRHRYGRRGQRPDQKRAVVTLAAGDSIEIFDSGGSVATWQFASTSRPRRAAAAPACPRSTRSPARGPSVRSSPRAARRPAATTRAGSRRGTRAAATSGGSASSTSGGTRTACRPRSRTIEYDPNRSARIALLHYADGEKRYILAPHGVGVGDKLMSGEDADIRPGQRAAASQHPGRHRDPRRRAQARRRRQDGALGRHEHPAHGQGGQAGHPSPALRRDAAGRGDLQGHGRRSSATPSTSSSRSARPGATGGSTSVPPSAAWP